MDFVPPPFPDDVDEDFGPYNRDEIVVARASLLHTLQRENSMAWQGLKYKLGILPNGHRLRRYDLDHTWLPADLPELWSAPVVLHDPTAPSEDGTQNQESGNIEETEEHERDKKREEEELSSEYIKDTEEDEGDKNREEELSSRSDTQVTCQETRLSSAGGDVPDSRKPSGKRKRESPLHSDNRTSSASGDCQDHAINQKMHENSVTKDGDLSRSVETSKPSTSVEESDAGEGSSKRQKLEKCEGDSGDQQYEMVLQCDLCPFLSQVEANMRQHLCQRRHYSASKYLAVRQEGTGVLNPVYLSKASLIREQEHTFTEKVPACPICHKIFTSVKQCLLHTNEGHQAEGLYSLRLITQSSSINLTRFTGICTECGVEYKDETLRAHIKMTQHMALYNSGRTSEEMMMLICPFCQSTHFSYFTLKDHLSNKHCQQMTECETFVATCYHLGKSCPAQTMLPQNPGICQKNISNNVTKVQDRLKGVKSKKQRQRIRQREALQKELVLGTEKVKKKKIKHKERIVVYKAKRKGKKLKKKEGNLA